MANLEPPYTITGNGTFELPCRAGASMQLRISGAIGTAAIKLNYRDDILGSYINIPIPDAPDGIEELPFYDMDVRPAGTKLQLVVTGATVGTLMAIYWVENLSGKP